MDAPPVQYVKTSDGYDIAFCTVGEGMPLVFKSPPFSDLRTVWQHYPDWMEALASRFELTLYNGRGEGLSTRNVPEDTTARHLSLDLEAVIERRQLRRFALWGFGPYAHVAIRYTRAHPERVTALFLQSCSVQNAAWNPSIINLAEENWEFLLRSMVSTNVTGNDPGEQEHLLVDFRNGLSQRDYLNLNRGLRASSVEADLPELRTPALVLQQREYFVLAPEETMKLAADIPNARFALLEPHSFFGDAKQGMTAIDQFLARLPQNSDSLPASEPAPASLSERELEVLRLVAQGKSNPQIAEALFITRSTVQNHVSSILIKLNLQNRAQAAVYAKEHDIV